LLPPKRIDKPNPYQRGQGLPEIFGLCRYDKSICTTIKGIQLKGNYQYIQCFKTINQSLMRKIVYAVLSCACALVATAQSNNQFVYSAIARDAQGAPVVNQNISVEMQRI